MMIIMIMIEILFIHKAHDIIIKMLYGEVKKNCICLFVMYSVDIPYFYIMAGIMIGYNAMIMTWLLISYHSLQSFCMTDPASYSLPANRHGQSAGSRQSSPCSTFPSGQKHPAIHVSSPHCPRPNALLQVWGQALPHSEYTLLPGHVTATTYKSNADRFSK